MKLRKHLYAPLLVLFALACARQTSPTGGPKDTIPPQLIPALAVPRHESTNFAGKQIQLTFDEMVIVTNPKEQIIITPSIGKDYKVTARNKTVTLSFETDLQDSTTYSFNFRDAVQDITEKNPAVNLKLAFSTGHYVDSLSIAGNVWDPLKNKEIKDATVALYQSDTFNIFKHTPVYFTKTDEKGNYIIENLKPGRYFVYAIEDRNRNLFADSKSEGYGFRADSITLTADRGNINISTIHLDARPLKLTNARPYNTYFNIKTSKSLARFYIDAPAGETAVSAFGEDRSNIRVFNTFDKVDSVPLTLHAFDSINNRLDTTLYAKFSRREVKPESFSTSAEGFRVITHKGLITGRLKFTKPLLSINFDSIVYRIDSLNTINFTPQDFRWDSLALALHVEKKFDRQLLHQTPAPDGRTDSPLPPPGPSKKENTPAQYQLYMAKGSFISIELDTSATIEQDVKPVTLDQTGVIITNVQTGEPHFIVELLDKSFMPVQSIRNNKTATFEDVPPAEYFLRLIIDRNNDGKWSPGNFYLRQEPEPVIYYKNEQDIPAINLKANWEIGPLLITY